MTSDNSAIEFARSFLRLADLPNRKDGCKQWTISGKGGYLQSWGDLASYIAYVATYSPRKWGAIKRKVKTFGWKITQDGDDEGCFWLGLPDKPQSRLRQLLCLRRKRQLSSGEIRNNKGVSGHKKGV